MSDSATPWTAAHQACLSITNSQSLLKLMSIESVMPSNHLIFSRPLLLLPLIFFSNRVFSSESVLCMRWPNIGASASASVFTHDTALSIMLLEIVAVVSHFSHVRLFVTLWTVALQAPLSMEILQSTILEWVVMLSSKGSSQTSNWICVSCIFGIGRQVLDHLHHLGNPVRDYQLSMTFSKVLTVSYCWWWQLQALSREWRLIWKIIQFLIILKLPFGKDSSTSSNHNLS